MKENVDDALDMLCAFFHGFAGFVELPDRVRRGYELQLLAIIHILEQVAGGGKNKKSSGLRHGEIMLFDFFVFMVYIL